MIWGKVHGRRRRGKSETPYTGNIAKLVEGNLGSVGTRWIAIDGEHRCEVLHGRLIVIRDETAKE